MHKVGFKASVNKNYNQSKDIFTSSYDMAVRPEISDDNLKILSSELIAKTNFAAGDVEKARSRLLQLQKEGLTWGGYRLLGDIYKEDAEQGNVSAYKDAISNYQTAIKLSNGTVTDADLHYNLGSSLLNDGQYDQAAESLRTSMSLQPNNSHVLNDLGVAYFHLNRRAEAQKLIERSVKLDDGCMSRFNLGTFLYESQQYYSAIKHFRHALRLCRKSKQNGEEAAVNELVVQISLAKSLRRDPKKTHESLALYRAVLKEMKSEKVRIEEKDNNEVMLASHDMQVGNILAEIGDILISLDRYVEAIDVIYESMEIRNKNGDNATRLKSCIDYGNSLLYAGRLKEAKDQYEIVLKASPTYVTAFNNLGVVAFRSKKFKEARMWFQKVLRHDSRHVEAKLALEQLPSRIQNFHVPILDDGVNSLVHKIVRDSP
jgi:tetratricopeptide (TPR) repeat protein